MPDHDREAPKPPADTDTDQSGAGYGNHMPTDPNAPDEDSEAV